MAPLSQEGSIKQDRSIFWMGSVAGNFVALLMRRPAVLRSIYQIAGEADVHELIFRNGGIADDARPGHCSPPELRLVAGNYKPGRDGCRAHQEGHTGSFQSSR